MSAEEIDKPRIPKGLEKAIQRLARETVRNGWDPGRVLTVLMRMLKFKQEVWPHLSKVQQRAVIAELKRRADGRTLGIEKRKPRHFRDELRGG